MRTRFADAAITTRPMSRMLGVTLPSGAETHCHRIMHAAGTNRELAVAFGTEASVFNAHAIPAIICGPGNIEQAHKPNEWVMIEQIAQCEAFLERLTARVSS